MSSTARRRVVLHVGAPKTGTSAVQDLLWTRREELRGQGVLYAADRPDAHFLAALDLMELPWGGLEHQATGAWDRLAAEVRAWPGTAIISHEVLASASRLHVARALSSLGEDAEVHLVYSARDLARQVPAEWQENVKHRRTRTYADFLAELRDPTRATEIAQWFWAVQEVPDVLDRWAGTLPPERVHLVTVPPPGADRTLLWQRFAGVFGLDPVAHTLGERANTSLGAAESAMVRRLNTRLGDVLPSHHYRTYVREMMVHQHLALHRRSPRLGLPPDVHDWAAELASRWVAELGSRGYDVVGDLADLVPGPPATAYVDPDAGQDAGVAEAALDALALMTRETARLRDVEFDQGNELADLRAQLDRFYGTRTFRAKRRLVQLSTTSTLARGGLSAYRRLRGSSSRST